MTTIKTSCPLCGDVELTPSQIRAVQYFGRLANQSYYEFDCTGCNEVVRKDASREIIALLRSGFVTITPMVVPAEVLELPADGPVLTADDVLDFTIWLERAGNPVAAAAGYLDLRPHA